MSENTNFVLFDQGRILGRGKLQFCLKKARTFLDAGGCEPLLFFDEATGKQRDFDLRGSVNEVLDRYPEEPRQSGPGRPKLGVLDREVSLLPRHWDWLESQGSSASAVIRSLIEKAMKDPILEKKQRCAALSRIISAAAGDLPGAEEVHRALYSGKTESLAALTNPWPQDVRDYCEAFLSSPA